MTHHREARLNEQLKREIASILSRKVRDPRVGGVLVTGVRVTTDLWVARVFIRPLEQGKDVEETLAGLAAASPFVRRELGRILQIRRIPELRFLFDETLDSALRIEEVLREVLPPPAFGEERGVAEAGEAGPPGEGGEPEGGGEEPGGEGEA